MSSASTRNTKKDKRITAEQTIILIRLIKKYKSLWNPNNKDFRNRAVSSALYSKIGSYFQLADEDVRRKFRRLRNCYMQELKLIYDGQKEHPSLFYFDEMEFLKEQIEERLLRRRSIGSATSSAKDDAEDVTVGSFEEFYTIEPAVGDSPSNNETDSLLGITIEELEDKEMLTGEEDVEQTITPSEDNTDEFDAFAGYLASQLREMDKLSALETMEELQRVISQRRIRMLRNGLGKATQPEIQYRYSLKRSKQENAGNEE